jgi:hypothetical protein
LAVIDTSGCGNCRDNKLRELNLKYQEDRVNGNSKRQLMMWMLFLTGSAVLLHQHSTIHIEPLENGQPPVGKHVLVTLLCPVTADKKKFGTTPEAYSSETISASAKRTTQTTEGSAAAGGSAAAEQQQATTHKQK